LSAVSPAWQSFSVLPVRLRHAFDRHQPSGIEAIDARPGSAQISQDDSALSVLVGGDIEISGEPARRTTSHSLMPSPMPPTAAGPVPLGAGLTVADPTAAALVSALALASVPAGSGPAPPQRPSALISSSGPIAATKPFVLVALAQTGAANQLPVLPVAADSVPGSDAQGAIARQSTTPIATLQRPITE
jgi:hypothetical protein